MLQPDAAPPTAGRAASWSAGACCGLAWLLPLLLGLGAPDPALRWQADLGLLQRLGLLTAGTEGVPSTIVTQLIALLPIGSTSARAGLLGALVLAVVGGLAFDSWRRLLDARRSLPLNPLLALLGSLLWTLSPPALAAAAEPGSGLLALCLLLLGLRLASTGVAQPRTLPLLGVLLGLCFGESHLAALVLLLLVITDALWEGSRSELPWGYLALGFALSAGTCLAVPWLRSGLPGIALDLGLQALPGAESVWALPRDGSLWRDGLQHVLDGHSEQLGGALGLLALLGLGAALLPRGQRRAALPWALLGLAGLLAQLGAGGAASSLGWRSLGWGALAAGAGLTAFVPIGLQLGLGWLWQRPVPFARPASVLGLAFACTLVLQRLERLADRHLPAASGAEIWTEAALERLPPRSVLLVESRVLGVRLLAAQQLMGARPDVLLVPLPLLQRGTLSAALLRRAPELAPLLRQLAVQGWADEAALARLAGERPLFLELDPRWSPRLLAQLRPAGLWLSYASREPSSLERRDAVEESRFVHERLREALERAGALDDDTRAALAAPLRQRALLLAALGDNALSASTLRELLALDPRDPLALTLQQRLEREQGRVALQGLLRR